MGARRGHRRRSLRSIRRPTGTIHVMEAEPRITPGRLRRLTVELIEERLGITEYASIPDVLVDENGQSPKVRPWSSRDDRQAPCLTR